MHCHDGMPSRPLPFLSSPPPTLTAPGLWCPDELPTDAMARLAMGDKEPYALALVEWKEDSRMERTKPITSESDMNCG